MSISPSYTFHLNEPVLRRTKTLVKYTQHIFILESTCYSANWTVRVTDKGPNSITRLGNPGQRTYSTFLYKCRCTYSPELLHCELKAFRAAVLVLSDKLE